MEIIDVQEFAQVMTPALFQAADSAAGTRTLAVMHKNHDCIPGSETEIDRASRVDVLSELDLAIQEMLLSVVVERWPYASVLVEEDTPTKARFAESSDFCVLIDPIDGTRNFLNGDPHFCHIVSLVRGKEMLATLLYSHAVDHLFVAIRGEGASILSARGEQHRAVHIPQPASRAFFHHVSRIPDAVLRELGDAGFQAAVSAQNASDILTLLDGSASGFISYTPLVYDVWSPGMIIQEAGGWISDWCGRPLVFKGQARLPHVLIASSMDVAALAIERLAKYV